MALASAADDALSKDLLDAKADLTARSTASFYLDHGTIALSDKSLMIIDEAGMGSVTSRSGEVADDRRLHPFEGGVKVDLVG